MAAEPIDYQFLNALAFAVGLELQGVFARKDGVSHSNSGEPAVTEPFVHPNDPSQSRLYRHIVGGNTSYGYMDTSGNVALQVRLGPASTTDPTRVIPEVLTKYRGLKKVLTARGVPFTPDESLEKALA